MTTAGGRPRPGIVGAGQLARMTYQAGISLGLTVRLLAGEAGESAARIGAEVVIGSPTSAEDLAGFAAGCDVLTFDHELVDAEQLAVLERAGHILRPRAATVALVQDKRRQRAELEALGFPVPPHRPAVSLAEVVGFGAAHGWPVVAKAARGGYDGRGVWVLRDAGAARALLQQTAGQGLAFSIEAWVPLERELAVLVARRPGGEAVVYPVVETVQRDGICHELLAPAPLAPEVSARAARLGLEIAEAVGVIGILAVELFLVGDRLLVNELAVRPHNSGHFSIEGCVTSQFENHLRAILDWPLGETSLTAPAVATVNVLGRSTDELHGRLPRALAVPGACVHLYDKPPRPGRKLGHVTVTGTDPAEVRRRALRAAALLTGEA
jgi:5-(carboxyamino)imidazole ribonucleotide synthase